MQPAIMTHLSQSTELGAFCGQHGVSTPISTASSPGMDIAVSCEASVDGITISCAIAGASDGIAAIASRDDGVKAIAAATMAANT